MISDSRAGVTRADSDGTVPATCQTWLMTGAHACHSHGKIVLIRYCDQWPEITESRLPA
jgi:hypothetical protein